MASCPNCRRPSAPREDNAWFPFCRERCKALDLGRWFGGGYRVPAEPVDPSELPAAAVPAEGDDLPARPAPKPRRRQ